MPEAATAKLESNDISYLTGVILVLMAGVFWSTMGLGIRNIEVANVWQILFYRSLALSSFLFIIITFRSGYKPFKTIKKAGIAGAIGGIGLVIAFAGGIYAIQTTTVANAMFLFASAPFLAAVLAWIILRESVRRATWVAMIFALARSIPSVDRVQEVVARRWGVTPEGLRSKARTRSISRP